MPTCWAANDTTLVVPPNAAAVVALATVSASYSSTAVPTRPPRTTQSNAACAMCHHSSRRAPFCALRAVAPGQQWPENAEDASMASRSSRILVVNPNSNEAVTRGLREALARLAFEGGPLIECLTLVEGPFGIETQEHVESVVLPLRRLVAASGDVDAFVIACYSDPGLQGSRGATNRPVFGINACGVATALARGERFGVIAIAQPAIRRHLCYLRQMGLLDRLAGERPLNTTVADTATGEDTF